MRSSSQVRVRSAASRPAGQHSPDHAAESGLWTVSRVMAQLWQYIKPHRRGFGRGLMCILATNAIGVLAPWVLKYAIQDLQIGVTTQKISYYAWLFVGIALVAGVFRYLMRRIIISISRQIEFDLRVRFFAHLQKLSSSFYDRQQTGDLMTRASSDIEAVRMVVGPTLMYFMDTILTAAFSLSLMFVLSLPLTFAVLALAPILSLLIYILAKKIHIYSLHSQESYSDLNAMIQEHLSGIRVIRAYCQEEPEQRLFQGLNRRYVAASMKLATLQAALIPFFYSAFGVGMAVVLYLGGRSIISGTMSLGDFVAFSAYVSMLAWPVMAAGWVINFYQRGAASLQRIHRILDVAPEIQTNSTPPVTAHLKGSLSFQNVSLTYPGTATPALKNIDLDIPAESSLGIVGTVGSGKSSLVNLVPRLYEISGGSLRLDGFPIETIPLDALRKHVAVVPQESFLFSDRLDQNILFAQPNLPQARLLEVSRTSHLDGDVQDFPKGYETWVGERGITLSGGQKQRASLARALAADSKIIIFDDCFSAVDTHTEAEILRNLRTHLAGKTALIVAHRISTLQWADQIIVLREGEIVERGTHEYLLERRGLYAELYRKQLLENELKFTPISTQT